MLSPAIEGLDCAFPACRCDNPATCSGHGATHKLVDVKTSAGVTANGITYESGVFYIQLERETPLEKRLAEFTAELAKLQAAMNPPMPKVSFSDTFNQIFESIFLKA